MPIIRIKKADHHYVLINRYGLDDARLSFQAKGLLAYLLTKPDGWIINYRHLMTVGPDGEYAIRSALNELVNCGYLTRKRRHLSGRYTWEQTLYDYPKRVNAEVSQALKNKAWKTPALSKDKTISSKEVVNSATEDFCSRCQVSRGEGGCWCNDKLSPRGSA